MSSFFVLGDYAKTLKPLLLQGYTRAEARQAWVPFSAHRHGLLAMDLELDHPVRSVVVHGYNIPEIHVRHISIVFRNGGSND